jgi:hypothetical protein
VNHQASYWIGGKGRLQLLPEKGMSNEDDIVPFGQFQ